MALPGCATDPGSDVATLRAELRAMRSTHEQLEQRLERLEGDRSVVPRRPAPVAAAAPKTDDGALPQLTVVKLKPRNDPAPRISTAVNVKEPAPETLEELASRSSVGTVEFNDSPIAQLPLVSYDEGINALRTGNVMGGVDKLKQFAAANPRDPRADDALYFGAMGQMGLSDYEGASGTLERLLREHPAGNVVSDALLKLAECRVRLNRTPDARAIYTRVLMTYPGTPAATQAEQRLASLSP